MAAAPAAPQRGQGQRQSPVRQLPRRPLPLLPLLLAGLAVAPAAATEKRVRIRNGCRREPIWIAHEAGAATGPDEQNVRIAPGDAVDFQTPPGLSATRYWPKMGCNAHGGECTLGGSGGPGESCVRRPPEVPKDDYSRCAPPVDTKFEGTFGVGGWDYVDMSLVDGWTLPFKLRLKGECTGSRGTKKDLVLDCSGLTFEECPAEEVLSAADTKVDLRAVNPRTEQVAGCYAPCQKLISGKWNNTVSRGRHAGDAQVAPYCCPTPPESPEACRQGPIKDTAFLRAVHTRCPGVYGYAYDDGMGLLKCEPTATYELTFFCPDAKTTPLHHRTPPPPPKKPLPQVFHKEPAEKEEASHSTEDKEEKGGESKHAAPAPHHKAPHHKAPHHKAHEKVEESEFVNEEAEEVTVEEPAPGAEGAQGAQGAEEEMKLRRGDDDDDGGGGAGEQGHGGDTPTSLDKSLMRKGLTTEMLMGKHRMVRHAKPQSLATARKMELPAEHEDFYRKYQAEGDAALEAEERRGARAPAATRRLLAPAAAVFAAVLAGGVVSLAWRRPRALPPGHQIFHQSFARETWVDDGEEAEVNHFLHD